MRRPDTLIRDILRWADAYFAHWGSWPSRDSGPVSGQIDLTWCGIDIVSNLMQLPRFTIKLILAWVLLALQICARNKKDAAASA
jgi:hypothetical protein